MNAKTDKWESYTDAAGRRHWRWPATQQGIPRPVDEEQRHDSGQPRWLPADLLPAFNRGR
jgi:hypothetical protein